MANSLVMAMEVDGRNRVSASFLIYIAGCPSWLFHRTLYGTFNGAGCDIHLWYELQEWEYTGIRVSTCEWCVAH